MAQTHETTFERDDETEVTVTYTITDIDPGVCSGPPEDCYPPEGGEVEIQKVCDATGAEVAYTDSEAEKWSMWIAENHDFDDDGDYADYLD